MTAKTWFVCIALGLLATPRVSGATDADEKQIAALRAKVAELEGANQKLQLELKHAQKNTLNAQMQWLLLFDHLGDDQPIRQSARREAMRLAAKLAPTQQGNDLIWRVLLKTGMLKDGMSRSEAIRLLGCPTETTATQVQWYFNPQGRHVAPFLRASINLENLENWKLGKR